MALEQIADKVVDTDVLVIGGGIAGCPAAAKAADHGLRVTLVEKSNTARSGSAAEGIDHYGGFFPRGMTTQKFLEVAEEMGQPFFDQRLRYAHPDSVYRMYANGQWAVEELEKLGVTMRWTDGEYRFRGCHHPGPFLRVHWQNVKPEMARGIKKKGVNVMDRTMAVDLLTHKGAVSGATAIDTRTGEFIVIKAKAVIMASGACSRIYNPETPQSWKYKYTYHWCPASVSGDGWGMAYRAGAEMANFEMAGRGTRFRDDKNLSYGNHGNEGIPAKSINFEGIERPRGLRSADPSGNSEPNYNSFEHLPDDYHKRIEVCYVDERLLSFKIAEERGFDPRHHWYEIIDNRPNQLHFGPGIWTDGDFKATLKGLYVAGDVLHGNGGCFAAATAGFIVGDEVPNFINEAAEPVVDEAQLESLKQAALAPLSVKDGTEPTELEVSVRYVCDRYVGVSRAEGKLREGSRRLGSLRREFLPKLIAQNPHYLMRALEVRNLFDIAEMHITACLERKESRYEHARLDYPAADPALDGMFTFQRLQNGKKVFEMRKRPEFNMALYETK